MIAVKILIVAGIFIISPDLCQPMKYNSPTSSPSRPHTSVETRTRIPSPDQHTHRRSSSPPTQLPSSSRTGEGTNHITSKGSPVVHTNYNNPHKAQSVRTFRVNDNWKQSHPSKPEPQRMQSNGDSEPLLGEGSSPSFMHTTGSMETLSHPRKVLLQKSHAMPQPEIEPGLKSPRKGSASPEKKPLLSTGKTAITTGGEPPKHSSALITTGITAGLLKIGKAITGKRENHKRLDKGRSPPLSPEEQIVFGVFKGEGGHSITFVECAEKCKAHFGEMYLQDDYRVPLALPIIVEDKVTKAVRCNCTMNAEQIRDFFTGVQLEYPNFLRDASRSFCSARHWLYREEVFVDIPYEVESKKLKSPAERAKFSRLKSVEGITEVSPLVIQRKLREEKERKVRLKSEQHNTARASLEDPSKKGECVAEISSEEENITVGVFPRKEHEEAFTKESCKTLCREFFGNVAVYRETQMGFTQPKLLDNRNTCSCIVNPALAEWAGAKNIDPKFLEDFRHFYCNGQLWFSADSGPGPFDIYIQYDLDAHPNREVKKPKLHLETFNMEEARELRKKHLITMGHTEEEAEQKIKAEEQSKAKPQQSEAKAQQSKAKTQQSKAEAQQSKAKVQSHPILVGSIHRNRITREILTTESCQEKCNDKFGFVLKGSESAPLDATGRNRPQITWEPIKFTTAKVSAAGKDCECYFNKEEIFEVLESKKHLIKTGLGNFKTNLLNNLRKTNGYKFGVEFLKGYNIHIVRENGSDKIFP